MDVVVFFYFKSVSLNFLAAKKYMIERQQQEYKITVGAGLARPCEE